jgi:sensor domain CHASE-containing protein
MRVAWKVLLRLFQVLLAMLSLSGAVNYQT